MNLLEILQEDSLQRLVTDASDDMLDLVKDLYSDLFGWEVNEGSAADADACQANIDVIETEQARRKADDNTLTESGIQTALDRVFAVEVLS